MYPAYVISNNKFLTRFLFNRCCYATLEVHTKPLIAVSISRRHLRLFALCCNFISLTRSTLPPALQFLLLQPVVIIIESVIILQFLFVLGMKIMLMVICEAKIEKYCEKKSINRQQHKHCRVKLNFMNSLHSASCPYLNAFCHPSTTSSSFHPPPCSLTHTRRACHLFSFLFVTMKFDM